MPGEDVDNKSLFGADPGGREGQLDELVSTDAESVHLERMTETSVWIGVDTHRTGAHGGDRYSLTLRIRDDGLLGCSLDEWPEEPPYEPERTL